MARILLPLAALSAVGTSILQREAAPLPAAAPAAHPGFVSYPIVERRPLRAGSRFRRRDDTATLINHTNVAYMIDLDVGTPAQRVRVQVDTGSNELWLDPDCSQVDDSSSRSYCRSLGVYEPSNSSTANITNESAALAYGIGQVRMTYVYDDMSIPGTNNSDLQQVKFGVATASQDAAVPILGVGYGYGFNLDYYNLIDELVVNGMTQTRAFSLVLGTTNSTATDDVGDNIAEGSIIFGGVDTRKFVGPLQAFTNLPPQSGEQGLWRYWIQLDSVGFTKAGSSSSTAYSNSATPVILDSGSTLSYLPSSVISQLASSFGVRTSASTSGAVQVDCNAGDNGGSVDFTFSGFTINIPIGDFLWEASEGVCAIGALPSSDTFLLGDTFLRSAYVLFDQDHQKIYMAKAASCGVNEHVLTNSSSYNFTGECTTGTGSSSSAAAGLSPLSMTALLPAVGVLSALLSLL